MKYGLSVDPSLRSRSSTVTQTERGEKHQELPKPFFQLIKVSMCSYVSLDYLTINTPEVLRRQMTEEGAFIYSLTIYLKYVEKKTYIWDGLCVSGF